MTLQEENVQLREKLKEYESILEKALNGPFEADTIASKVWNGFCRMTSGKIVAVSPKMKAADLKIGKQILRNDKMINCMLPEELTIAPTPIDFKFIDWEDIGGLKSQIETIRDSIELPMKQSSIFKKYGVGQSRGIVLYGPPGCGKTMVAKAIASQYLKGSELNKDSFIYLKGGEMLSKYVGESENNIKNIFERARNNFKKKGLKSVIFIDEAEAILPARGSRRSSDVEKTIVPTFLSELDGFEESSTLLILATNYVEQLDSAVTRPGRIDVHVEIGRPDHEDLVDIFKLYLGKSVTKDSIEALANTGADIIMESGARENRSGALVRNIVEKASIKALKRELKDPKSSGITKEDILEIIKSL